MSAEETGNVPSALARRIAEAMNEMGFLRADTNIDLEAFEQAVRFLDREIAKAGAFIPAETLEQVEKAMDTVAGILAGLCNGRKLLFPPVTSRRELEAALAALRAARSEGAK